MVNSALFEKIIGQLGTNFLKTLGNSALSDNFLSTRHFRYRVLLFVLSTLVNWAPFFLCFGQIDIFQNKFGQIGTFWKTFGKHGTFFELWSTRHLFSNFVQLGPEISAELTIFQNRCRVDQSCVVDHPISPTTLTHPSPQPITPFDPASLNEGVKSIP